MAPIMNEAYSFLEGFENIFSKKTVFTTHRKLPNLKDILAPADIFSRQETRNLNIPINGFTASGDNCSLCKPSLFSPYTTSYFVKHWIFKIPQNLTCKSPFKFLIYKLTCSLCQMLPYFGKTKEIKKRFSNHLSHCRTAYISCELSKHAAIFHHGIDPSTFIQIQLLEGTDDENQLSKLEDKWRYKLMTWQIYDGGLNSKQD